MYTLILYKNYPTLIKGKRQWACQIFNRVSDINNPWVLVTYSPITKRSLSKAKEYHNLNDAISQANKLIKDKLKNDYTYLQQDPRHVLIREPYYEVGIPIGIKYPLIAQPYTKGILCLYDSDNGFIDSAGNIFQLPHIAMDTKGCIVEGILSYKNMYQVTPSSILEVNDLDNLLFNITDVYDPSRPDLVYKDLNHPNNDRLGLLWDLFKPLMISTNPIKWTPIEICTDPIQLDLVGARYLGLDFDQIIIRDMGVSYKQENLRILKAYTSEEIDIVGVGKADDDTPIFVCQECNDEARCFTGFIRGLPTSLKGLNTDVLMKYLNLRTRVKHYSYTSEGLPLFSVVNI